MPNYKIGIELDADDNASSAVKNLGSELANFGGVAAGLVTGGVALLGGALAGIGAAAFSVASDVDSATDQIGASLGIGVEAAAAYGNAIKNIYGNNFGDSIGDVGSAVEEVAKQLKLSADDPALPKMTQNALRLRDVFKVDVASSLSTVKGLVKEFGITNDQAFDLIAKGYQRGLDSSGDMLDSLNEYGPVMAANGFSAEEMFSIMESGAGAGVLGTDKIMDAMKEMGIILNEGTTGAREALAMMGMDFDTVAGFIKAGDEAWADYFPNIVAGLQSIEDPLERNKAQVALFGTMAEDLGVNFTDGLSTSVTSMKDMEGATESLDAKYTNLGGAAEGMWRKFQLGIAPIGEAILSLVNGNMPVLEGMMTGISGSVNTMVGSTMTAIGWMRLAWDVDLGGMKTKAEEFMTLDQDFAVFWERLNLVFANGQTENEQSWATWLANGLGFVTSWGRAVLDSWGMGLLSMRTLWDAWGSAFSGDWEGFWSGLGEFYELTLNQMLNWVELVFGPGLRNNIVLTLGQIEVEWQAFWASLTAGWQAFWAGVQELRSNLGMGSLEVLPVAPSFGSPQAQSQSVGATTSNSMQVTINAYGTGVASEVEEGVLNAGRRMGMR